ncbi:hypothetical protein VNO77_22575 [Canavalia gladiata]|uniref:Uncharacterized protein n=1 Tax=Canavalia gladiata TaxID=3824 RepID=A0AAN9L638_CANGL
MEMSCSSGIGQFILCGYGMSIEGLAQWIDQTQNLVKWYVFLHFPVPPFSSLSAGKGKLVASRVRREDLRLAGVGAHHLAQRLFRFIWPHFDLNVPLRNCMGVHVVCHGFSFSSHERLASSSLRRSLICQVYKMYAIWPGCPGGSRSTYASNLTDLNETRTRVSTAAQLAGTPTGSEVLCFNLRRTNPEGSDVELAGISLTLPAPLLRLVERALRRSGVREIDYILYSLLTQRTCPTTTRLQFMCGDLIGYPPSNIAPMLCSREGCVARFPRVGAVHSSSQLAMKQGEMDS